MSHRNRTNSMAGETTVDAERGGMEGVSDEELERMLAMLSKLSRHQGMKIPGVGSFSRDELIHKMQARDPQVFLLIAMYRGRQAESIEDTKRYILNVLDHAPSLDRPVTPHTLFFLGANEKGYTAREFARQIREGTPEGNAIVQNLYDERCQSRARNLKRNIDSQPIANQALFVIRSIVYWGRLMIEEALRLGKTEQKKIE